MHDKNVFLSVLCFKEGKKSRFILYFSRNISKILDELLGKGVKKRKNSRGGSKNEQY